MVTSATVVQRRTPPAWVGFAFAAVITGALPALNVLHATSQRWGRFGGPYTYGYWAFPSFGLIVLLGLLAVVAHAVQYWPRFGVGLVVGAVIGLALSFTFTAFFFKYHTDSYLFNRPECIDNAHPSGSASCLNREQRELREQQRQATVETDRWP